MGDDTRAQILNATRQLLKERAQRAPAGHNLTVAQVAAAAHVSRATVYRHFPSKAALLRAAGAGEGPGPRGTTPRERILNATLELIAEQGFHATTLGEIAQRAGLSLSGLHWHYRNRDELVADLARYIPLLPALEAEVTHVQEEDLETQLTRLAQVILKLVEEYHGILRFILFEAELYPEVARMAETHTIGRGLPLLTRLFEGHARRGTLRPGPARVRAQAFMGMFVTLALLRPAFAHLLEPDAEATAREYIQILLRGVLAAPEGT